MENLRMIGVCQSSILICIIIQMQRIKSCCSEVGLWFANLPLTFKLYLLFTLTWQLVCYFKPLLGTAVYFNLEEVV
jgi:hypothetical protein